MKIGSGGMFDTINIAVSGLKAYNRKIEVISSNIANIQTTDAGKGEPYRRLIAEMSAESKKDNQATGVEISDIVQDQSDFEYILNPGHPQADENGYVAMPNVNWPREITDLNIASKAYQANAAILKRYQKMVESSLELLR
jgi:flagellar basal-body rod protein FlgC